jgi:hypothetical protein
MPATAVPDTGHGATVTFATTSWSGKLVGIPTNLQLTRPRVDTTHLGTSTNRSYMPGDVNELGEITLDVLFEGTVGLPAIGTAAETITITFPLPGGGAATAPNIAGTGFITGVQYPPLQTGTVQQGQITFTYNGGTGPTYTAAS